MSNRAWVTLATNDSYGLGALVLANSLRRANTAHATVVLITPSVTDAMRNRLGAVFAEVISVDVLDSRDAAHLALLQRPELGITFTKIHCWALTQYEKCVFLDADTLVVQNCDELFEREELSAAPDVGWPDCFNSGVFVFVPSNETYSRLITFAQERGSFDGGDQGLLNAFFSDWAHGNINKHLPFLYNVTSAAFYSYIPALKHYGQDLKIIHFIGAAKPWLQQFNWESRTVDAPEHLRQYLQLWWDLFVGQVHSNLDIAMELAVEIEEVTLASPSENLQEDVQHHYEPTVDADSEFPWHHPESQYQETEKPSQQIILSDIHDPWEHYRGNIPPRSNYSTQHSDFVENQNEEEIKEHAWEYQKIYEQNIRKQPEQHYEQHYDSQQNQQHYNYQNHRHEYQHHDHQHQHHDHQHQHHDQHNQYYQHQEQQHKNQYQHEEHDWQNHFKVGDHNYQQEGNHHQSKEYNKHHEHSHLEHTCDDHSFQSHHHHQLYHQPQNQYEKSHQESHHNDYQSENQHEKYDHHDLVKPYLETQIVAGNNSHKHSKHISSPQSAYKYINPYIPQPKVEQVYCVHLDHKRHTRRHRRIDRVNICCNTLTNGYHSDSDSEEEFILPRHPYDGFYLRHKATIDPRGRKICTHEIPPTPSPSPPSEESPSREPSPVPTEEFDTASECEDQYSGVAGNLARVVPGTINYQREAIDELTRRQGWEAGNIDYMGADSFDNIWAKISQTLNQQPPKQPSPPRKEPTPPKEPSPPKEQTQSEAVPVPAKASEATPVEPTRVEPTPVEPTPAEPTPVEPTPAVSTTTVPTPAVPTPAVPTPAVPTPAVPTPAVPTPAVPTPAVPTPAVPTPAVPTPAVPTAVEPTVVVPTSVEPEAPAAKSKAIETKAEAAPIVKPAVATPESPKAETVPAEIPKTVEEALASAEAPKEALKKKTESKVPPTPPATPKSEASSPVSETPSKIESQSSPAQVETPKVAQPAPKTPTSSAPAATPKPAKPQATPEKPQDASTLTASSTDSPPLANTPSKEEAPAVPAAKTEERRKPAGKLQLSPPGAGDALPTPDSEQEDAAALAHAIIASELSTVTAPSPAADPASPPLPLDDKRLSVEAPEVTTPPVSLAQIGVKPKGKPSIAALIESSVSDKPEPEAPSTPTTPPTPATPTTPTKTEPGTPSEATKKKPVKKGAKKEAGPSGDVPMPVPPPRKKEKKPKEK